MVIAKSPNVNYTMINAPIIATVYNIIICSYNTTKIIYTIHVHWIQYNLVQALNIHTF